MAKLKKLYLIPSELYEGTGGQVLCNQVLEKLNKISYFFVENVKTTRRFISSLKLGRKIEELIFFEINDKFDEKALKVIFSCIPEGEAIGLLSDAGSPSVADPGAKVVWYAHRHNIPVVPLVGPSSILLTLMASGFNGQLFSFHGYVPVERKQLNDFIKKIENESLRENRTQLFMDTPYRNNRLLEALIEVCKTSTKLCVAANLTSDKEYIYSAPLIEWKKNKPDLNKQPAMFALYAG